MFKVLRRKVYKPKPFGSDLAVGKYIHKSDDSLDTITSSHEDVMQPNTLDLMNGHAHKDSSADVTSADSEGELVDDPAYASVDINDISHERSRSISPYDSINKTQYEARQTSLSPYEMEPEADKNFEQRTNSLSPYENQSQGGTPLDLIIADLERVGSQGFIEQESEENGLVSKNEVKKEMLDENNLDVGVSPDPLYSVVKKPKKKKVDDSKQPHENKELSNISALIDSIVSEMDLFISDTSEESNEELTGFNKNISIPASIIERTEPVGSSNPTFGQDIKPELPPRKAVKVKSESTPNIPRKLRENSWKRDDQFPYDSVQDDILEEAGIDFQRAESPKKSVSFNDVILEIERPRSLHSDGSSMDIIKDKDRTDVKQPLDAQDQIISTNNYSDLPYRPTGEDMYRRNNVTSYDLYDNKHVYTETDDSEMVAILTAKARALSASDDVLSVPGDDDLYSSNEETEEEPEEEVEEYKPVKVKRHAKSRTILLLVTWFILGMSTVLPGTILPYLTEQLSTTWEPLSRGLFAKGIGFFIGSIIAGLVMGCCHGSIEMVIIIALLLSAAGLVSVPWFMHLVLFCGSAAAQGIGRGLFQVASHLLLIRIWKEDSGVKLIHALYITFAAGCALIPQITRPMIESHLADDIYHYMDKAGMDDILRMNGYNLVLNGSTTLLLKSPEVTLSQPAVNKSSNVTGDFKKELNTEERMYIIYLLMAALFLCCALVFTIFFVYTCVLTCKKKVRDYKHKKKTKTVNKLKEQIAQSVQNTRSFDHLNGKSIESGKDTNGKTTNGNGNNTQNGKGANGENGISKEDSGNTDERNEKESGNGIPLKPKESSCNGVANLEENVDHVTHVTTKKKKVSFRLSIWDKKRLTKKAKRKKQDSWFLNGKPCSTATLMYLYVFFSLPAAIEMVFSYFIYIFAMQSDLALSELSASLLLSTFWGCMMLSRILAIPLAKICPPNGMIILAFVMNALSATVLAIYGWRYKKILWLFTAFLGTCLGPILPAGFTWANIYIKHNAKSIALAYSLASVSLALFSWVGGMVLQYYGFKSIMYLLIALTTLSALLFLPAMRFLKANKVFKFKTQKGKDSVYTTSQRTYV